MEKEVRLCLKSPMKGRKRTELVQSTRAKKNTHTNRPTDLLSKLMKQVDNILQKMQIEMVLHRFSVLYIQYKRIW
jgi:hypothetical protein